MKKRKKKRRVGKVKSPKQLYADQTRAYQAVSKMYIRLFSPRGSKLIGTTVGNQKGDICLLFTTPKHLEIREEIKEALNNITTISMTHSAY